jgi:hypothetical protein
MSRTVSACQVCRVGGEWHVQTEKYAQVNHANTRRVCDVTHRLCRSRSRMPCGRYSQLKRLVYHSHAVFVLAICISLHTCRQTRTTPPLLLQRSLRCHWLKWTELCKASPIAHGLHTRRVAHSFTAMVVVPHELPQLLRALRSCTSWNHTSTTKVQCRTHTPRRKGESSLLVWRWQGEETLRPGRPRRVTKRIEGFSRELNA